MKLNSISLLSSHNINIIKKVITSAYIHHVAKFENFKQYKNIRTGLLCYIHPTSSLSLYNTAEYIIYHDILYTTKEYMRIITVINPKWLIELAPTFYKSF